MYHQGRIGEDMPRRPPARSRQTRLDFIEMPEVMFAMSQKAHLMKM
jgi:hypothetical protein